MPTFQQVLSSLRMQEPTSLQYDLSNSRDPDVDELKFRLAQTTIQCHKEWTNFELYKMLKSGHFTLESVIPCKHCTK